MNAPTSKARPATPPLAAVATSSGDHIESALREIYQARALIAGARLLANEAAFPTKSDKDLRLQSVRLAKRAAAACMDLTTNFDGTPLDVHTVEAAERIFNVAEGLVTAAQSLLEATWQGEEFDACLQARDLFAMALQRIEASGAAVHQAFDAARREAA